ncbi:hypothetical protein [Acinetobacter courvalinii]|uniref:hypothetical protein n=1 Tax=Acinetobacter courvalinii TaxID=280147 RepID=UPI0028A02A40|nr:hypothetical protein [Acinetobacter courvalinii]
MYKVKRNPQKFETFDLFSTLVEELGYSISQDDVVEKVSEIFSDSVKEAKKSDIMLYGARNEGLFSYIVRGMSSVKFIKKEDAGDAYTSISQKIQIPDFRLILEDNSLIFVEVKNWNKTYDIDFNLDIKYVESLERYCSLNNGKLFIAVFYRCINRWVLLPISRFKENKKKYEISLIDALKYSEFSRLGDIVFALDKPLEIYFEFESNILLNNYDGNYYNYEGKIKNIVFKCGSKEITDDVGRKAIFLLAQHGGWPEQYKYIFENDKPIGLSLKYEPEEGFINNENEVGFKIITQYSVMLTNFFAQKTLEKNVIVKLLYSGKPANVTAILPDDYKNSDLPIIRLQLVAPN